MTSRPDYGNRECHGASYREISKKPGNIVAFAHIAVVSSIRVSTRKPASFAFLRTRVVIGVIAGFDCRLINTISEQLFSRKLTSLARNRYPGFILYRILFHVVLFASWRKYFFIEDSRRAKCVELYRNKIFFSLYLEIHFCDGSALNLKCTCNFTSECNQDALSVF